MALASYVCQHLPKVFITAAPPEDNLKLLLWSEILRAAYSNPSIFGHEKITQDLTISPQADGETKEDLLSRLIKGLIIPATGDAHVREAKFSGKHSAYLAFICDEGDAIPPEVYKGIDGCLSGGTTRLMIFFNPRKQSGPVWDLIKSGRANVVKISAFDHPNVITGDNVIPGAVTQAKTIQRINEWTRPLVAGEQIDAECFQVPEFLIGKAAPREDGSSWYEPLVAGWRHIEDPQFSYKVLAQYPAQSESGLIPRIWYERAVENGKRYLAEHGDVRANGVLPRLGYDIAESLAGDENVISARFDNVLKLGLDRWKGMDIIAGADRAERRYFESGAEMIAVDATSIGAGTAPTLRQRKVNVSAVKVAERPTKKPGAAEEAKFHRMREQLMWAAREWFGRSDAAIIPENPNDLKEFEEQCLFWDYEKMGGEIKITTKDKFKEAFGYSPDLWDSVILTFADKEHKFFHTFTHDGNVIAEPPHLVPTWKYFSAFSYSTIRPCCYLIMAIDFDGRMYLISEYYKYFFSLEETVTEIFKLERSLPKNNPRDMVPQLRLAGENMWIRKEKKESATTDDSLAAQFAKYGIHFTQASDNVTSAAAATRKAMTQETLKIVRPACPNTVRVIPEIDYEPGGGQSKTGYEGFDQNGEVSVAYALMYLVMHCYHPNLPQQKPIGWRQQLRKPQRGGIRFHNN